MIWQDKAAVRFYILNSDGGIKMKLFKKCPLFILVFAVFAIIAVIGIIGKNGIYSKFSKKEMTPVSYVFEGAKDKIYPWNNLKSKETYEPEISKPDTSEQTSAVSSIMSLPPKAQEKTYDFTQVDKSYFDDALFIGDSRTVGLSMYSDLDNATYYADVGESIYRIFNDKIAVVDGKSMTIDAALSKKKFAKIYFSTGINELGTGTAESFGKKYSEAIDRIKELQPDAIIFAESIIAVGPELNAKDSVFNNKNINERNAEIKKTADNKTVFYIDANEALADKNGNLSEQYSNDGLHLKAKYYDVWTNFLMTKGIVKN
jgi:lysophospholipase L1-like esterase